MDKCSCFTNFLLIFIQIDDIAMFLQINTLPLQIFALIYSNYERIGWITRGPSAQPISFAYFVYIRNAFRLRAISAIVEVVVLISTILEV